MGGKNYLPANDGDFIVWFNNFVAKLNPLAASLDVTPAQLTKFQSDLADVTKKLDDVQAAKTKTQALVREKNAVLEDVQKRVRDTAIVLKRHPNFTLAIGEDIGIVPPDVVSKENLIANAKPYFQTTVLADKVRLDWVKGEYDGVVVQCRRGNETSFSNLNKDTKSPYDDNRSSLNSDTPETREYRMRYLIGDEEVGNWSDIARVVCMI